ncbi:MAG: glycosyltransferase [Bacteroidales bacterium]
MVEFVGQLKDLELFEVLVSGIFLISFLVQMFYYIFFFLQIRKKRKSLPVNRKDLPKVSVIICAKNEAENLTKNLPVVLEQDYPSFEVVVVNDCSTDNTADILADFKVKYKHLKVTYINPDKKFTHGKKLAVTVGIKAAGNEYLLFTDADCFPSSDKWIETMARHFNDKKSIVLGYGGFVQRKSFLNNIIRYDTLFIALQYLTFAMRGLPYMGVGRNLAYKKSLFFENKGFASHNDLPSGDDDLFVNEVSSKQNTSVETSHEAHTRSEAKLSFAEWWLQKKRHLTTGGRYRAKHKFTLGMEIMSRVLYYAAFIYLLIAGILIIPVLILFFLRMVINIITMKIASTRLNEKYLLLTSLVYDFILPIFYAGVYLSNAVNRKKYKWK